MQPQPGGPELSKIARHSRILKQVGPNNKHLSLGLSEAIAGRLMGGKHFQGLYQISPSNSFES
jgi:hypothetical protein